MNIEISPELKADFQEYMQEFEITPEEAVGQLLSEALTGIIPPKIKGDPMDGAGMFSSPEDAAMLDEIVADAYRRRRPHAARDLARWPNHSWTPTLHPRF